MSQDGISPAEWSSLNRKEQEGPGPELFPPLHQTAAQPEPVSIALLARVELEVTVQLGQARRSVRDVLSLAPGSVLELDRAAGEPVDILVNGRLVAKGEVVVIGENFGIRVTELISVEGARP